MLANDEFLHLENSKTNKEATNLKTIVRYELHLLLIL